MQHEANGVRTGPGQNSLLRLKIWWGIIMLNAVEHLFDDEAVESHPAAAVSMPAQSALRPFVPVNPAYQPDRVTLNVSWSDEVLKRIFDVVFALAMLILVLPLMIVLAVALQIDSPGSIWFTQRRIGRHGRMFHCIKFRTMHENAAQMLEDLLASDPAARAEWEANHKLQNDPRVSAFGSLVRKLSMDELPQLLNILRGEMSVVGPRPIVQEEVTKYGEFFRDYCAVKPGLTGLWQVSGRNDVSYDERVQLDCRYTREMSFKLDLQIVLKTVTAVTTARGSY